MNEPVNADMLAADGARNAAVHVADLSLPDTIYPFAALIGQEALQRSLLLVAVDPGIGGVLVAGPRGTAKSTAARALAELLPDGRLVTLPLSATDEQVTGTLDLASALAENAVRFRPGLIARAHLGVMYVDEVNLLPDALVDALLDAAASGVNTVERDGISHRHAARFALVGTMNPEEGELRPQLLDRFGMMVELGNITDPALRQRIVKARLAFDADPQGFRALYAAEQVALAERIRAARAALPALEFDDAVHARVSALCIAAAVDGLRGDLVLLRAARALAALEGAHAVETGHVERIADDVLRHRRTQLAHERDAAARSAAPDAGRDDHADRGPAAEQAVEHGDPARDAAPGQHVTEEPSIDGRRDTEGPRGGLPSNDGEAGARAQTNGTHGVSRTNDGDWGYLPPEPVGIAQVKGVIALPLPPKKR